MDLTEHKLGLPQDGAMRRGVRKTFDKNSN